MGAIYADDMALPLQRMTIAHLMRVVCATSYWRDMIEKTELKNNKKIFRGLAKVWYKRTNDWINQWHNEIAAHAACAGPYEAMLDTEIDFRKEMGKFIFFHEQALKRMLDKMKIPFSDTFSKIATARDLIECAAICNGLEMAMYPKVKILNNFCGYQCDPIDFETKDGTKPAPNLMGRLLKLHGQFTQSLYQNIGKKVVLFIDDDPEVERSISITAMKMQDAFTNYDWICKTADEHCHEWIAENAEEYAKQVKEIERGKAKEKARRERAKAKKEAGFSVNTDKGQLPLHGLPSKDEKRGVQYFNVKVGDKLPRTPQLELVYSMEIAKLTTFFNWRIRKFLPSAGIVTIGDLLTSGKDKVVRIPGIGAKSWEDIKKGVIKLGISIQ